MAHLAEWWQSQRVILMDGAMGTQLLAAGLPAGQPCEAWNLSQPQEVRAIHQAYVEAGAECVLTNTFQAHPKALARYRLADSCEGIIEAAIGHARAVAGPARAVLAAFGPVEEDWNEAGWQRVVRAVRDIDGFLLETFSDLQGLWIAKYACLPSLAASGIPVLLSITYRHTDDGTISTQSGHSPEVFASLAKLYGVQALGVNCGREIGRQDLVSILKRYRRATDLPLFVRPNAGAPVRSADGFRYPISPEEFASWVPELIEAGATMLGGCCGTTPAHVRAIKQALRPR